MHRSASFVFNRAALSILTCALIVCYVLRCTGPKITCWTDVVRHEQSACRRECPRESFSLPDSDVCHPKLSCSAIRDDVSVRQLLARGVVKNVYLAEWKGHTVVLSNLTESRLEDDFQHNVLMHGLLGHPDYTVQVLGSCGNTLVTEYLPLGSANNLQWLFSSQLARYDTVSRRFSLCLGYVAILRHLHAHRRLMCDSNTLAKTLSQYLVHGDLSLRVNDLDALPRVTPGERVTCGTPPLHGELLAPEQRGNMSETASCNLKCDVWKVPDVCLWLLGNAHSVEALKFRLFPVHRACKEHNPERRPDTELLWREYLNVWARWEAGL
ncbi:unnamed protein product [Ixodes hexagonus]